MTWAMKNMADPENSTVLIRRGQQKLTVWNNHSWRLHLDVATGLFNIATVVLCFCRFVNDFLVVLSWELPYWPELHWVLIINSESCHGPYGSGRSIRCNIPLHTNTRQQYLFILTSHYVQYYSLPVWIMTYNTRATSSLDRLWIVVSLRVCVLLQRALNRIWAGGNVEILTSGHVYHRNASSYAQLENRVWRWRINILVGQWNEAFQVLFQ